MLLQFENGESFATGATSYLYHPARELESTPRIILSIRLRNFKTLSFLDTGGVYVLCSPEIAKEIGLQPGNGISTPRLRWSRGLYSGELFRVPLTFLPTVGTELNIEATVFVPDPGSDWPEGLPCVLGMMGCLERLRFAVDPATDTFYFGAI